MTRRIGAAAGACALVLLGVYLLTMAPGLTWAHHGGDGGDLVRAVARASWPHPPGFPTYLLIGSVFLHLPAGTPAWRLNALSAVSAALACGLVVLAVTFLLRRRADVPRRTVLLVSVVAGSCLGLAPLLWSQAVITEVYAPAALFAAGVLLLTLSAAPAWLLGLVWGAGLGVHFSLLALAPLVGWRIWQEQNRRTYSMVVLGATALAFGGLYVVTFMTRRAPSPWITTDEPAHIWSFVRADLYRGYVLGLPWAEWPRRLVAWASLLVRQFTPIGMALILAGMAELWAQQRTLCAALLLAVGGFSIYAVGYNTADSLVYLVPALPLAVFWLALGMLRGATWLQSRLTGRALVLLAALPLLQLALYWGDMDVHNETAAIAWGENVLTRAPADAVLLTERDEHTFTLWYMTDVLHMRPDITVIDKDLWAHGPYRALMSRQISELSPQSGRSVDEVVTGVNRPIVHVPAE